MGTHGDLAGGHFHAMEHLRHMGRAIFCFHRLNGSMAVVVILLNPI